MMDELLSQFLIEGRELVQRASDDLLALERGAANPGTPAGATRAGLLDGVFRAVHTLKGSVCLFDFGPMASVLHAAEDRLDALRRGGFAIDRAQIDALMDCVDAWDRWIDAIAVAGALPAAAAEEARRLTGRLRDEPAFAPSSPAAADGANPAANDGDAAEPDWVAALLARARPRMTMAGLEETVTAIRYAPARDCFFLGDDPMAFVHAIPALAFLDIRADASSGPLGDFDPFACTLVIEALSRASIEALHPVFQRVRSQVALARCAVAPPADDPGARILDDLDGNEAAPPPLRVDAARIDALVDLVGELIVAKNGLAHVIADAVGRDPALAKIFAANLSDIDRLVRATHRAVMGVRMLPFDRTFRRLPRVVRAVAASLGKQARLSIEGGDVEADKTIVDGVFEPLLHLVRNAVDHGIESAEQRLKAGKDPEGRIILRAERGQDRVVVSVIDDGAGIDPASIRRAARASALMDAAALDALDDAAVIELIFTPGFSTASRVSDISGRGVGMDAVRGAVTRLGGRIEAVSAPGAGSTFRLLLPQSFALNTVIVVGIGTERYGVPIDVVLETARIGAERVLPVGKGRAFVLRERTIPLARLADLLGVEAAPRADRDIKVLIAAVGDRLVAVEVDGFAERIEVMLRPMSGLLSAMPGLLGTALMGDGRILMVLDLPELLS